MYSSVYSNQHQQIILIIYITTSKTVINDFEYPYPNGKLDHTIKKYLGLVFEWLRGYQLTFNDK
uniref:AlNc14C21G2212 protein n=1 Tax=Albugo laibachii Nc14 TaxID=890382 RepID=F0W5P7_9STRA|nr:AlNc14C21G2212 [Albugo laibachii Nc14]|eukprot:CCA16438.1 AlNc14C21G2212 [Albugo laibachii Nc14]